MASSRGKVWEAEGEARGVHTTSMWKMRLSRKQVKRILSQGRFEPRGDVRGLDLLVRALNRRIHVWSLTVPPAEVVPCDPDTLTRVEGTLAEEPNLREALVHGLLQGTLPALLVYRNAQGRLCVFDDYATLAVAREANVPRVRVVVLGEGAEWLQPEDASPILRREVGEPAPLRPHRGRVGLSEHWVTPPRESK